MEVLQTVGNFYITSEKIDDYTPKWVFPAGVIGVIGLMIGSIIQFFSFLGGELPQYWGLGTSLILGISVIILFAPSAYYTNVCGVSISINGTPITTRFALSNNADRDAKKIKRVVDNYVKVAQKINAKQKADELSQRKIKQECCTRYNNVIGKVKTE